MNRKEQIVEIKKVFSNVYADSIYQSFDSELAFFKNEDNCMAVTGFKEDVNEREYATREGIYRIEFEEASDRLIATLYDVCMMDD